MTFKALIYNDKRKVSNMEQEPTKQQQKETPQEVSTKKTTEVLYARVSRTDSKNKEKYRDGRDIPIETQISLIQELKGKMKQYLDVGLTAKVDEDEIRIAMKENELYCIMPVKRPALLRMIDDAKAGKINKIFITKWDRLSRNILTQEILLGIFKKYNVEIESIVDSNDSLIRRIISVISQDEVEKITQRNLMRREANFNKGQMLSRAPLGYTLERNSEGKTTGKVLINEKEATKIRAIFETIIQGKPYKEISKEFEINTSQYYNILHNKNYCGILTFKGKEKPANFPALVSLADWELAQKKHQENNPKGRSNPKKVMKEDGA